MTNPVELEELLRKFFSTNRSSKYGIELSDAAADFSELTIHVTFFNRHEYCCSEPGCHFSISGLRSFAAEHAFELPDRMRVRFHGIVEEGTCFPSLRAFGLPCESERYEFVADFDDATS